MRESTLNIAIDRIRKALGEIGEVNDDIFTLLLLSATRIDRLTEQLRLANEDAERMYLKLKMLEWHDIGEICPCCFTENPDHEDDCEISLVLRLHKERIQKG